MAGTELADVSVGVRSLEGYVNGGGSGVVAVGGRHHDHVENVDRFDDV
jgi:hypothetical protein